MFKFDNNDLRDENMVLMSEGFYELARAQQDKEQEREIYDTRYYAVEDFICTLPNMIQKMLQPAFEKFNKYEDEALEEEVKDIDKYATQRFMRYGTTETDILTKSLFYEIGQHDINSGTLPDFNFTIYSTQSLLNLQYRLEQHPKAGIDATTALLLVRRELNFREDIF